MKADIIQMAREAGFSHGVTDPVIYAAHERFAKLVAKKCAEIADTAEPYQSADLVRKHFGVEK